MPQGKVEIVPEDGLTTRQRRRQAVLAVHTGHGKGKSTAAFGMALRQWTAGSSVAVFQFVKSAKWRVGEETALKALGELHTSTGQGGPVEWHKMGEGWSWSRKAGSEDDHADAAREGWAEIRRRLESGAHDFYVLDEFTYPLKWGWIDVAEVVEVLRDRPGFQHVVITGRDAPDALVEVADLVTEMTKIKHPMDAGQKGQKGIEW
jgi:cob(I)alamin adenosyltransferase